MHRKRRFAKEPKEFDEEVIQIDRVTRVVKGGRRLRFRALVAIGNRKGKVGIGTGKSTEVAGAIKKAITSAKKQLITIPVNHTTIPHETKTKFKGSQLLLMPASEGTGIIAGGPVRKVIALSGIKDILGKSYGSNNKLNITKAAFNALKSLRTVPGQKTAVFKENKPARQERQRPQRRNHRKPEVRRPEIKKTTQETTKKETPKTEKKETPET